MKLPMKPIKVEDLKCPRCGKAIKELKPKHCKDKDCPYKKKKEKEK